MAKIRANNITLYTVISVFSILVGITFTPKITGDLFGNLGSIQLVKSLMPSNNVEMDNVISATRSLKYYTLSLDYKPDPYHLHNLALVYLNLGDYENSLNAIQQAITLLPDNPFLYFCEGRVYEAMGDRKNAVSAWRNANAFDYFLGEGNRAETFASRVYYYELITQIAPDDSMPHYVFADFLYYNSEERDKAIALYRTAVSLDTTESSEKYFALGKIAEHAFDWPKAELYYQRSVEQGGNFANLYMALGDALKQNGADFESVENAYQKAHKLEPLNKWAYWRMRNLYVEAGKSDNLLKWYEEVIPDLFEKSSEQAAITTLLDVAEMHKNLGDCKVSSLLYQKVLNVTPDNREVIHLIDRLDADCKPGGN